VITLLTCVFAVRITGVASTSTLQRTCAAGSPTALRGWDPPADLGFAFDVLEVQPWASSWPRNEGLDPCLVAACAQLLLITCDKRRIEGFCQRDEARIIGPEIVAQ
jgi:hypothetical protein